MALLVYPGDESKTVVVDLSVDYAKTLRCRIIEKWPYIYQLDKIVGAGDNYYRFDIWVDEEGSLYDKSDNMCATLAAHPLNEVRGLIIKGPALLVPIDKTIKYTLDDWRNICQGVWYDSSLVTINVNSCELRKY